MNEETNMNELYHYGVSVLDGAPGRGSGRYAYGSGEEPYQHSGDFLSRVKEHRQSGMSDTEIAKAMGLSTTQFRVQVSIARQEERTKQAAVARKLLASGLSPREVAKKMGYANDSSIRNLIDKDAEQRMKKAEVTAEFLKEIVDKKGMVDVGVGVERELNVSRTKLDQALHILEMEGYKLYGGRYEQPTNPGQQTTMLVLSTPDHQHKEIYDPNKLYSVRDYEKILVENGAGTRKAFEYPSSLDSSRMYIRYPDEGGADKDGLIELRRGPKDLYLGDGVNYSQVRILVDDKYYLKGMAAYSDDMPDGVDVIFNTSKHRGLPMEKVLKPITSDPDNPFGALIKEHGGQSYYDDPNGKYVDPVTGNHQSLSLINKRANEGDWAEWSKELPAQFLAKQPQELVTKQLKLSMADKAAEFEEIMSLTNPTVKKNLLYSFASDCDSTAVKLKAASMPRQQYQVIFPLSTAKDNECYAPNYNNGEELVLIRFPHAGQFEAASVKVNNHIPEAEKILTKNAKDVVGINAKVAAKLSGADFDGDTVLVIPNVGGRIKTRPALKGLEGFDPKEAYGPDSTDKPYKRLDKGQATQTQMGMVSNLITDMTIRGASDEELARAVRHSMVIIDAAKHNLDYKRSEIENGIPQLKKKYQHYIDSDGVEHFGGASTLLSRAGRETSVLKRQGAPRIAEDGSIYYKTSDNLTYVDKDGKVHTRTQKSTEMAETKDARTLLSGSGDPREEAYADYANYMKAMANRARKEYESAGNIKYDPEAAKKYAPEVKKLNDDLAIAEMNAPRERRAIVIATSRIKAKTDAYPELKEKGHGKELKKLKQQEMVRARQIVGARRHPIDISDKQWEAIQAGAISDTKLTKILRYADSKRVRELATPRTRSTMTPAKENRLRALKASGYTNAEIANVLGISTSTVSKYLND